MLSLRSFIAAMGVAALSQFAVAAPVPFSGTLSAADPTYNRPLAGSPPTLLSAVGTAVSYDVFEFTVTFPGQYELSTLSASLSNGTSDDTFISLYQNAFDPLDALANAVAADDDSGDGFLSLITEPLSTGVNYFLVVTSFGNGQYGDYTGQIDKVGRRPNLGRAVFSTVPEPSMLVLVPLALAGLGLSRRRRAA